MTNPNQANPKNPPKPLVVKFSQLLIAMESLHQWNKADMDRLHDVWKMGAPSPNSIIRNPKGYDPRKPQAGNYEARILFPTPLAEWIVDVSKRRGHPYTLAQAFAMLDGRPQYTP